MVSFSVQFELERENIGYRAQNYIIFSTINNKMLYISEEFIKKVRKKK